MLEQQACDDGINIDYLDTSIKGLCVGNNICIKKDLCNCEKFWVLAHELEHYNQDAFYTFATPYESIKAVERKINDSVIKKYNVASKIYNYLKRGCDMWEICCNLNITMDLFYATIDYLKRKGKWCYMYEE